MIYLDNAATSLMKPPQVARAVYEALASGRVGNADRGGNDAALAALSVATRARERLGRLFHYEHPARIAFTLNATDALNMAIHGLVRPGDHVVCTVMEHNSVLRPLYLKETEGAELTVLPFGEGGCVRPERVEEALRPNTRAAIITHASNLTGAVNDIAAMGRICRERGVLLVVDAAQTAGLWPIDMEEMQIDVLCFSGHKGLLGPQGTGGLCVREGVSIAPLRVGGSGLRTFDRAHPAQMPAALEAGTLNLHGIAGLDAGVAWVMEQGEARLLDTANALALAFYREMRGVEGVTVYGDFAGPRMPIVALNIRDCDSGLIADMLMRRFGIATRSGGHCAPLMHEALGTKEQGAVRFSFSHANTRDEAMAAAKAVRLLARG